MHVLWKMSVGGLYTELFYMLSISTLFPYVLLFCYPYILLNFNVFITCILVHIQTIAGRLSSQR